MELVQSGQQAAAFSQFERAVERMEGLETIPAVAQRLLALTSDSDAALEDIAKLIVSDAALTTRVLRLAASAFYGGQSPRSVQAAVVRLGLNEVRNLAVSAALAAKPPDDFHRSLWQHALSTAALSEVLAKRLGKRNFCEPFICALLHELGTLVMAKIEGAAYQTMVGEIGSEEQMACEQERYGFTHCDIGALAVQRWGLFDGIEQVIQFHHDPLTAAFLEFPPPVLATVYLVSLASAVARSPEEALRSDTARALLERLGTTEDVVREELEKARTLLSQYLGALH